jgi:TetR/AcrR family transcriptional regulator
VIKDEKLPRREREKLAQRQEILASALELFSEKGYRNVSMAEIAEKAEFAIGTLYKFFENKEDLYRALLLQVADKFLAAFMTAIEKPGDEVGKLRGYVAAKAKAFRDNAPMIRLYFSETHGARQNVLAGMDSRVREMREGFLGRMAGIFESGMRRRRFRRIADPYHLAIALEGLTNNFLFLWLDDPAHHASFVEDPDIALNILFKGLLP